MVCENATILYELGLTRGISQVPVIALFTKYDQFKRNIKIKLKDEPDHSESDIDVEVKRVFEQHYLASLSGHPPFMHLESEDFVSDTYILLISDLQRCTRMANGVLILLN